MAGSNNHAFEEVIFRIQGIISDKELPPVTTTPE
jgi:hypothetical protein